MSAGNVDLDTLRSKFFCSPNELDERWLDASDSPDAELARRTLSGSADANTPILLPLRCNGLAGWYVVCLPHLDSREIREQLQAFVGPSYARSTFQDCTRSLNNAFAPELAIIGFLQAGSAVYRIGLPSPASGSQWLQLCAALKMWLHIRDKADPRQKESVESLGRALRNFHQAVNSGLRAEAEFALAHIRERFPMDGLNPVFMEVFLLGKFEEWQLILSLRDLQYLVKVRPPRVVLEILLRAVYNVHLSRFEGENDVNAALHHFKTEVRPQFGSLYEQWLSSDKSEVQKSFLVAAASCDPQSVDWHKDAVRACDSTVFSSDYLVKLCEVARHNMVQSGSEAVSLEEALQTRNYELVIKLASTEEPSPRVAQALLICAVETRIVSHIRKALQLVQSLSVADRQRLLQSQLNRILYITLTQTDGESTWETEPESWPLDWCEWIDWIGRSQLSPRQLTDRTLDLTQQWDMESFVQRADLVDEFIDRLEGVFSSADTAHVERLRMLFPHVWSFFTTGDPEFPRLQLHRLYDILRLGLALDCQDHGLKSADLRIYYELCAACLETASCLNSSDQDGLVSSMIAETMDLWRLAQTEANLPVVLDVVDVLLTRTLTQPHVSGLQNLVISVLDLAQRRNQSGRLETATSILLRQLLAELQLDTLFSDTEQTESTDAQSVEPVVDPLSELNGVVAIHSLTDSALNRVKTLIESNSQCRVEIDSSKVGNSRLRDLARNADLFVVVTWSSKHAATQFIEAHRLGKPIVKPSGKGTSSILRALTQHIRDDGGAYSV